MKASKRLRQYGVGLLSLLVLSEDLRGVSVVLAADPKPAGSQAKAKAKRKTDVPKPQVKPSASPSPDNPPPGEPQNTDAPPPSLDPAPSGTSSSKNRATINLQNNPFRPYTKESQTKRSRQEQEEMLKAAGVVGGAGAAVGVGVKVYRDRKDLEMRRATQNDPKVTTEGGYTCAPRVKAELEGLIQVGVGQGHDLFAKKPLTPLLAPIRGARDQLSSWMRVHILQREYPIMSFRSTSVPEAKLWADEAFGISSQAAVDAGVDLGVVKQRLGDRLRLVMNYPEDQERITREVAAIRLQLKAIDEFLRDTKAAGGSTSGSRVTLKLPTIENPDGSLVRVKVAESEIRPPADPIIDTPTIPPPGTPPGTNPGTPGTNLPFPDGGINPNGNGGGGTIPNGGLGGPDPFNPDRPRPFLRLVEESDPHATPPSTSARPTVEEVIQKMKQPDPGSQAPATIHADTTETFAPNQGIEVYRKRLRSRLKQLTSRDEDVVDSASRRSFDQGLTVKELETFRSEYLKRFNKLKDQIDQLLAISDRMVKPEEFDKAIAALAEFEKRQPELIPHARRLRDRLKELAAKVKASESDPSAREAAAKELDSFHADLTALKADPTSLSPELKEAAEIDKMAGLLLDGVPGQGSNKFLPPARTFSRIKTQQFWDELNVTRTADLFKAVRESAQATNATPPTQTTLNLTAGIIRLAKGIYSPAKQPMAKPVSPEVLNLRESIDKFVTNLSPLEKKELGIDNLDRIGTRIRMSKILTAVLAGGGCTVQVATTGLAACGIDILNALRTDHARKLHCVEAGDSGVGVPANEAAYKQCVDKYILDKFGAKNHKVFAKEYEYFRTHEKEVIDPRKIPKGLNRKLIANLVEFKTLRLQYQMEKAEEASGQAMLNAALDQNNPFSDNALTQVISTPNADQFLENALYYLHARNPDFVEHPELPDLVEDVLELGIAMQTGAELPKINGINPQNKPADQITPEELQEQAQTVLLDRMNKIQAISPAVLTDLSTVMDQRVVYLYNPTIGPLPATPAIPGIPAGPGTGSGPFNGGSLDPYIPQPAQPSGGTTGQQHRRRQGNGFGVNPGPLPPGFDANFSAPTFQ